MALGVDLSILNQKGTPAFFSDIFANRPTFGFAGRVFISTDTGAIYEDTGTAWTLIADAGAGTTGTLQQVTTNGNTTTQGISITAGGLSSNSITNTSLTTGSVAFVGAAGLMTQDNANFFWDDTNNRLGLGTITPSSKLDIHGSGAMALFNGTGANNGYIGFQNAGATKWTIGNLYNAGVNSFEFLSAAFSTLVMSLRSNGSAQEIYMNGYNTISNVANFSSAGNYASNPSLTIAIPTSTVFNNGASWSGLATSLLNTWGSNNTVTNGASFAGIIGVNRNSFSNAGVTITVDQATGNRAIAGLVVLSQTGGTNNGTISHGASLLVQGVYPTGTANVTYTNYYGLLLNQLDEFGTVTFTNRWGIYQGGASDKNYFAANTLIGTTTDAGYKLDVNGTGRFTGNITGQNGIYQSNAADAIASNRYDTYNGGGTEMEFNYPASGAVVWKNGSERMRLNAAGNVGIGVSPSQKLEVYAGNSDGVKINANDVPSLFFYLQGGSQKNWGIATTNLAAGDFGIYQSNSNGGNPITAGTARLSIDSSGAVTIAGSLSKGSGSFRIDHPLKSMTKTHQLVHSFIEGPQADLIYRGKLTLVNGKAQANIDEVCTMTEGTFEVLCREVQCFTTNESGWDLVKGKVIGNIIYIESQNPNSSDEICWMVIGERKDKHIMDTEWTDDNGKVIVEPLKPIEPIVATN